MQVDVFIAGGGLAGLTLARQLKREVPSLRILVAEKRTHPASRSRAQGRRVERRDRRALFPEDRRSRAAPALRPSREARPALLLSGRRQPRSPPALRARAAGVSAGAVVSARSRSSRKLPVRDGSGRRHRRPRPRQRARRSRSAIRCTRSSSRRPPAIETVQARWLVDASGRGGLVRRRFELTRRGGAPGQRELVAGEHAA